MIIIISATTFEKFFKKFTPSLNTSALAYLRDKYDSIKSIMVTVNTQYAIFKIVTGQKPTVQFYNNLIAIGMK